MKTKSKPIILKGARQNNLKGVDLSLYPGEFTVITGLSGTGKSTLLFDVLHAEGQRRYVETFSPYVRQFMEALPRPHIESMTNARPSIAVEQKNSIRNSRSTVGTMTELCDYFKVWFSQVAKLHDPDHPREIISEENTSTQARSCLAKLINQTIVFGFWINRGNLNETDFLEFLVTAGHSRIMVNDQFPRIEELADHSWCESSAFVVVDQVCVNQKNFSRVSDAISLSLELGKGLSEVRSQNGNLLMNLHEGLRSSKTGKKYSKLGPGSFSFNSPVGACVKCKGFGKVIEINPQLVVPDPSLTIRQGAIKPFEGKVYKNCLQDLLDTCGHYKINPDQPWEKISDKKKELLWHGDPQYKEEDGGWYGIKGFFKWLEKKTYKMHVRVFLSKYRGYFECPDCKGSRFKMETEFWRWNNLSLSDLYSMPISDLSDLLQKIQSTQNPKIDLPLDAIRTRLGYLRDVGLEYLSLSRSSRSLSGGETQRINLTACLGAGLTDTLFALDEPTIGLHNQDIGRLVKILKDLASSGNIVCVVEHDEQVIRAADRVIEIGPQPGTSGGEIIFNGSVGEILRSKKSPTGKWLGTISNKPLRLPKTPQATYPNNLQIKNATINNLQNFEVKIPLGLFACISGLSGSGKSTLMHDVIYKELIAGSPKGWVKSEIPLEEVILIDQSTVAKSPRSNPVLFVDAWNPIKEAFGRTEQAKASGFYAADFSFNSGNGRCDACSGLGYETIEMQFLPDISVPCSLCDGSRFKEELLEIRLDGLNVSETLNLTVSEAQSRFTHLPKTHKKLSLLIDLGLGYLRLGQPLNTLSGGESQRLKLVKFMSPLKAGNKSTLILLDEPTTGLHLSDVQQLINCLRKITQSGNSLLVIEHHSMVLQQSDWILELGPGAGKLGGKVIANGSPLSLQRLNTPTSRLLNSSHSNEACLKRKKDGNQKSISNFDTKKDLEVIGAHENNLKNLSINIPSNQFVVVTGPSGSGKSSLAFDVIFAEGQRRFMESMSSYARQFVEQIGKPKVDLISGISPTVAIEQRIHRGSKKSTVGSITEIAQYLRLLYARVGIQCSPINGSPLIASTPQQIYRKIIGKIKGTSRAQLFAPLITNRKGHHKPLVNWAREQGFQSVRCDGEIFSTDNFKGLDRFRLHDVEVLVNEIGLNQKPRVIEDLVKYSLDIGKGRCLLISSKGENEWFSIRKSDPSTGVSYPDLEPSLLSWNSPRGWCPSCRGYGKIYDWMKEELPASGDWWKIVDGDICPTCKGERLSEIGRNVFLKSRKKHTYSLPKLLSLSPCEIRDFLNDLVVTKQNKKIIDAILPDINERLSFMENVGLDYLSLDRETASLSGGESQRIRLAGQLGSNLSGVLYVLDEPSIGLHPSDNQKLINSLRNLQEKGNSLLVVEHDMETILQSDYIIEIGPKAGENGGMLVEKGTPKQLTKRGHSQTAKYLSNGMKHPIRGFWRNLPSVKQNKEKEFLEVSKVNFRNLKNVSVKIPMAKLTVCCGVSGAGKSSLIRGVVFQGVERSIRENSKRIQSNQFNLSNGNLFRKAIEVSQAPIGKTSRSTPATYLGVWSRIRELISNLPEAKVLGLSSGDFSFNVQGGRCENCKGAGVIKVEMNFLPDSYIKCEQCLGKRYKDELIQLRWHGKNIAEILEMTFEEAEVFFHFDEVLCKTFSLMTQTGLGYLKLGQTSPTLSGGEAQRLKLASELAKGIELKSKRNSNLKKNFYVLEEPTIGLHPQDCEKLTFLLHKLVDDGHTVVVIEHDVDLIAEADYVIEIGPKGGLSGGKILHEGTIKSLLKSKKSQTAAFLKKVIP